MAKLAAAVGHAGLAWALTDGSDAPAGTTAHNHIRCLGLGRRWGAPPTGLHPYTCRDQRQHCGQSGAGATDASTRCRDVSHHVIQYTCSWSVTQQPEPRPTGNSVRTGVLLKTLFRLCPAFPALKRWRVRPRPVPGPWDLRFALPSAGLSEGHAHTRCVQWSRDLRSALP